MRKVGTFLGRLGIAVITAIVAGVLHFMNPAFIVLYVFGILFGSIAAALMEDHNGVARIVIFSISAVILLVPSFVLIVLVLARGEGNVAEMLLFPICATSVVTSWYACGTYDTVVDVIDIGGSIPFIVVGALVWWGCGFNVSVPIFGGIALGIGLIEIFVLIIIRIKRGEALYW